MNPKFVLVLCKNVYHENEMRDIFKETESVRYHFVTPGSQICGLRWGSLRPNVLLNFVGLMKTEQEKEWWNHCIVPCLERQYAKNINIAYYK